MSDSLINTSVCRLASRRHYALRDSLGAFALLAGCTAPHFDYRALTGAELLGEVSIGGLTVEYLAAGEDINRGIAELRPGVDREMRLGDDDYSRDSYRIELVEHNLDDGGTRALRRFNHDVFNPLQIVKALTVAVKQIHDDLAALGRGADALPPRVESLGVTFKFHHTFSCVMATNEPKDFLLVY